MALQGSTQMDMMDYLRQYGGEVKNRVMNPGQTLATALQQGMPTEQNPLGMFGFGGLGTVGKVAKAAEHTPEELFMLRRHSDGSKITLPDSTKIFKMKDNSWVDEKGKIVFEDTQHMYDSLKDLQMVKQQQQMAPMPDVMRSNRPSSPFYKDPFPMETPK